MKKLLLFILVTLSLPSFGQQHIVHYTNPFTRQKSEEYYLDSRGQYTGKYTKYDDDGVIQETLTYLHGELNGKDIVYYSDVLGRRGIDIIKNFKNGQADGLQQVFHDEYFVRTPYPITEEMWKDGKVLWEKHYTKSINGKVYMKGRIEFSGKDDNDGEDGATCVTIYSPVGKTICYIKKNSKCFWLADPTENNKREEWYSDANGNEEGVYKAWYPNGKLSEIKTYSHGVLDGPYQTFDSTSGVRIDSCIYKNGVKVTN